MPSYFKSSRNFKDQQRIFSVYRKSPLKYERRKLINRRQQMKYRTKLLKYQRLLSKLEREKFKCLQSSTGALKTAKEKFQVDHKGCTKV